MKSPEETLEFLYRLAEHARMQEDYCNREGLRTAALVWQGRAESYESVISFIKGELDK